MYSRALNSLKVVLRRSSKRYQVIFAIIAALGDADNSLTSPREDAL
jgi:hypothetical protein